jgi:hypothetical protein
MTYKNLCEEIDRLITINFDKYEKNTVFFLRLALIDIFTNNLFTNNSPMTKKFIVDELIKYLPENNTEMLDFSKIYCSLCKVVIKINEYHKKIILLWIVFYQ